MTTQKPQREKEEVEGSESRANGSVGSHFSLLSAVTSSHLIDEADEIKEVKTLLNKGKNSFKSGDFLASLSFFNAGLEIEEGHADLLAARCVTYMNISQAKMAAKDAQKLISLHPKNSQCLFLQSLVLKCQGQTEESLNLLVKSLSIANKLNQRLVEEIEELACQFLKILVPTINPQKNETDLLEKTYQVGVLLFNYQKYKLCVELLDNLMRFLEHHADIKAKTLFMIASASSGLRKRDQALQLYEECLRLASETNNLKILTRTLANLANIHLKNGDIYQSIFCFEKLVEVEKNLNEDGSITDEQMLLLWSADFKRYLRLNLRITYKTVGNLKRAYSYTQEYVCLVQTTESPERIKSELFYLLGDICESLGKYSLALKHYEEYLCKVEACGYGNLISKAYGCLGRINGKLNNWDTAFYYHSLHMKSASGIGSKEIIKAKRLLADTYFLKKDFLSAICIYEKISTMQIGQNQLCEVWLKLYQSYGQTEKPDIGLKYLENSLNHSRLYGYEEITILCEYHSANIYCSSYKEETLQLAELYFKRVIHFLQGQIECHLQDGTQCPANFWSDLLQCYKGMQMSLVKHQQTEDCLQYAEILQQILSLYHRFGPEGSFLFSCSGQRMETLGLQEECSSLEAITYIVNQQRATVCYYSLLRHHLLIWIFQPGKGIVETIVQEESNPPIQQQIKQHLVNFLQFYDKTCPALFSEGRSLPQRTEENVKNSMPKRESSRANFGRNEKSKIENSEEKNTSKFSSLTSLYNLLLHPLEHILCKLPDRSHLVFIANDVLQYCPFGALQDSHGTFLGERFSVAFIQSMAQLSQIIMNTKCTDLPLKNNTELQFLNVQKSHTSAREVFATLDSKSSFLSQNLPDGKKVSNPKALKTMRAQHGNPSKTNPGMSSSSLHLINSNVGYKNCFPMIGPRAPTEKMPVLKTNEHKESILVMTNPQLPEKSELYSQEWHPAVKTLQVAESEGYEIASSLGIFSINGKEATKKKFLELLPTASVVHIATWASCQEGLLAWSPSSVPVHPDSSPMWDEFSYLVTCQEISSLSLHAKLVILSCGQDSVWRGLKNIPLAHYLANAFLQAGAHSVLLCLKPVPDVVRRSFFKHFYAVLQNGNWVSEALWKAQKHIATKDRFKDVSYWSPFVLLGQDCYINLQQICQAMMHQLINSAEQFVKCSSSKSLLTPGNIISEVPTMEQNLNVLQEILGKFLQKYSFRVDLIQIMLQLLINWPGKQCPPTVGQDLRPVKLPSEIAKNDVSMSLLKFLGFNFVAKNVKLKGSYVLYPYQVTGSLLQEVCLALSVIKDFSTNYDLIRAWCCLLPLKQETISSLIDLMYITKLAWGLQLHLTDLVVQSLWHNPDTQRLLTSIGYQQIGRLLNFHASPRNRKLLTASLQFGLSLSCHQHGNLMKKFDAKQFGLSVKSQLQNIPKEARMVSLNSLGIVHLPRKQFGFQIPWMRAVEQGEEMKEKINLIRKHEQMKEFYKEYTQKGNNMYQAMFATQAQRVLNAYGKKSPIKATKVKVFPGGTASRERIPCIWSPLPSLGQVEQTRQQAYPAVKQWQKKMNAQYKNDLFHIYLPYASLKDSARLGI